ncbi:PDZ domain (Also known as DHR or GLGF) [Mucilaginibacter mallensis]|uniref:PDZ domain (Also known as DHR or GLGF) n=1 Tax=Mucilaginibacter mallensis TaxID=652787 RepID=A0A1H2C1T2_MUCMA|nr:aspartyl protease family protein [Mucilaginibacter mallensis]SDT64488.1 PDZ domain (Also known as DHR or GLGF) [Mucilaginibacter mallensis]
MKLLRAICLCVFLCYCFLSAKAQYFDLRPNKRHVTIHFRIVRNMIIIPLKINNTGPYNFILDTGVGLMVITQPSLVDSISLTSKRTIKIPGLGAGDDAEAYVTPVLNVDIQGLDSYNVSAAILKTDYFGLSNYAGMHIHGLLGYEFFNNLAVKLNFGDSTLNICRPKDLHAYRHANKIPITIEDRKPYMQANILYPNDKMVDSKLVIDIGAGHPISIEHMIKNNGLPQKFIAANLGIGLNGPIDGFISRINEVDIGRYKIKNVLASFPDDTKTEIVTSVPRDGNLGIGLLKKFDVIFDYTNNAMYLKPGFLYKEPYEHDMSGLEYYATGTDYQHVIISRVEPGSAGDLIGLEKGDEIVTINFRAVSKMNLEEIDALFKSKDERTILLEIFHDNKYDQVIITLKRRI